MGLKNYDFLARISISNFMDLIWLFIGDSEFIKN